MDVKPLPQETPWPPARLAWHAVILLGVANLFSFVDRFMLSLVVGPLKRTFDLSDTEVGLLQGLAFGVFYTLLGIPIGRLADRYNRRTIVGWAVALWSLMTALFGLARNYTELFLCRMGVGVGEAALNPCAVSLISDYFPEEKRATALGVYTMSAFIGGGLAILLGGTLVTYLESLGALALPVIGEIEAWQLAFICVGTPGLFVGLLMMT
ncbi:MFS transporter, partial [Pseudomonadales bacterium]|nr:MFS transporter [Pseudomonadales bacterium]